ncbi:uncharacterized protein LOC143429828 [Xylocopa sonorina]|uniref:uncharacterized protein LOC143429828 n=1 Tax=Xylocopa sonorina TaxID=1818115 RepID=UPI00403B1389
MRAGRVAALLAAITLLAVVQVSRADARSCKNIVRNVIINSCKGPRSRRSVENVGIEVGQLVPRVRRDDPIDASVSQQKRQLHPRPGTNFKWPLFGPRPYGYQPPQQDYTSDTSHDTELSLPGVNFEDRYESKVEDTFGPPMPYGPVGYALRSANPDDFLGFSLTSEELEELHDEVGDRISRNPKESPGKINREIFQQIAKKCCANAKLCENNPSLFPCMGY